MYRDARSVAQHEQKSGRRSDLDLLVIARGFQFLAPGQQRVVQFSRPFNGCLVDGFSNLVQLRVGSIQQDHAPIGKQA